MAGNLTLAMIKPHVIRDRHCGEIIDRIEKRGFGVLLVKMVHLRKEGAEEFYKEHEGKPFYKNLVNVMCSGPVWVMVLAKANAVEEWRAAMGVTHPAEAAAGTIRRDFGDHNNITNNAVHGSASDHDAQHEIDFFFSREISLAERINTLDSGEEVF